MQNNLVALPAIQSRHLSSRNAVGLVQDVLEEEEMQGTAHQSSNQMKVYFIVVSR